MKLIDVLEKGERVGDLVVKGKTPVKGRLKGHQYMELEVLSGDHAYFLMYLGLYEGKTPYYLPWIEWFSIENKTPKLTFFDSDMEEYLLDLSSSSLPPGGRLFVDYSEDKRTLRELNTGVPPPLSRLGFLMLQHGFTWFKDWYFPEGFNEGNHKLQGEKPLNDERRKKHLASIREEVEGYMESETLTPTIKERAMEISSIR